MRKCRDEEPRDRTLEIITPSGRSVCSRIRNCIYRACRGCGERSRVTVAKVLPYGAERRGGRHRWLESSYSKFRIHTTWQPRRDGVNNSLLFSSISHTSPFPPPVVSASGSHAKQSPPSLPQWAGSLIQMKRKQFQVPQDRMSAPPCCSEALGWTRTRPPCREAWLICMMSWYIKNK